MRYGSARLRSRLELDCGPIQLRMYGRDHASSRETETRVAPDACEARLRS